MSTRHVWVDRLVAGIVFVLALFLISFLHEVLVLGVAFLVRGITSAEIARLAARLFLSSPVYSDLMLKTLGGVDPIGISVYGTLGHSLHEILPGFFQDPQHVGPGSLVSAVVDRNSTVLGILVTRGITQVLFLLFGLLAVRAGWHRRHSPGRLGFLPGIGWVLLGLGLFVEAQSLHSLAGLTLSPRSPIMRDTGIGFGLSRILGLDSDTYRFWMDAALPVAIPLALILLGLVAASISYKLLNRVRALVLAPSRRDQSSMPMTHHTLALAAAIILTASTPWSNGHLSMVAKRSPELHRARAAQTPAPEQHDAPVVQQVVARPFAILESTENSQTESAPSLQATSTPVSIPASPLELRDVPLQQSTPAPTVIFTSTALPTPKTTPIWNGPARTEIRRGTGALELFVNDQRTIAKGMNYNVNYTGLPEPTKFSLHRRDMRLLRDAGVNAIIGWGVYDEITLQVAAEFQIGVVMPFELDAQGPFENEAFRRQVMTDFSEFVLRYREHPAVWGWNPGGDELLHRMDTEQHRTPDKIQSAADLLVEMSALAHSLDPERISIVKEPRDWYIPFLDVALSKERSRPSQPDPGRYFVFGLNVYGNPNDVADALVAAKRNAEERLGVGMIVGEYAPFGMPRKDRAEHYAGIWDQVLADTPNGGFAYVYGPDQPNPMAPNPYDPLRLLVNEFSLVDIDGMPVDGSLAALSTRWRAIAESGQGP